MRTNHYLSHIASLDELLQSILVDVVAILHAQRGAIVLYHEAGGQLRLRAEASPNHTKPPGRPFSKTLAERCYSQGNRCCAVTCRSMRTCSRRSVANGSMSSVICVLLRSPRKRLGVLHLDRSPLQEPFSQEDFCLADAIVRQRRSRYRSSLCW